MKRAPQGLRTIVFLLISIVIAYFLQFYRQAASWTFLHHSFSPAPGTILISAGLVFCLLISLWASASAVLTKSCIVPYKDALALDFPSHWPLVLLALAPLTLNHYLTSDDLRTRLFLFLLAVAVAIAYLKCVRIVHQARERQTAWTKPAEKFMALALPKKLLLLFLAALLVYSAGSLFMMSKGIMFSGDEPHYLLVSHSLLHDGDLDLTNNYARKDYQSYTAPGVTLRAHTVPGLKPNSRYSFHSPGVSFLMVPFYALGGLFGDKAVPFFIRLGMGLFGALLGIQMYLFARQEWRREKLALGLWLLFSFTSPVFFYSIHVYPEIMVGLFSLAVFRLLRFSPDLSRPRLLLCGFLLSSFIWFHALKYLAILGPLLLYGVWALFKRQKGRHLAYFLIFPALIIALYLYFQYSLYGSLNPTSVSWQGAMDAPQTLNFFKELLTGIPLRYRLETLAGYFLDQRDGLLFYAPIYFFSLLGLVEMFRRRSRSALLLFLIAAPYVLLSASLTQRTGYAPQARPLVAVIWAMAILLGYFLAFQAKKIFSNFLNFAIALSFLFVGILLRYPLALYQETTYGTTERGGDFFYRLSNLHFSLTNWLPSYLKVEDWRWLPNFVWPGILAAFLVAYLWVRKHDFVLRFSRHLALTFFGLAVFFSWFVFYPRVVLYPPLKTALPTGDKLTFYGLSRVALMRQPGRFALLEDNRDYSFTFTSWRKYSEIKIEFGSLEGEYALKMRFFDQPMTDEKTRREIRTAALASPPAYPWKKLNLYQISIHLERLSDVRTVLNPYVFAIQPAR